MLRQSLAALLLPLAVLAACEDSDPLTPAQAEARLLADIRAGTTRFQDVAVAVAEGYVAVSPCVSQPGVGAMGVHYLNPSLLDGVVDPSKPEVLLYEPRTGGAMRLVGAEFMVAAEAWDATHTGLPKLAGRPFDDHRAEASRHGIPIAHYDLHAWAWVANPGGAFAPMNPAVTCP